MRGAYLLILLVLIYPSYAQWAPDVDNDGCIDQQDYDSTQEKLGAEGNSDFDVDGDDFVDQRDLDIIQSYLDREEPDATCNGFKCISEQCNSEDDDCDGAVDEDEDMCGTLECRAGECVKLAGKCYDTDGKDIFSQGTSTGITDDDNQINGDEECYEVDIYNKLKEIKQCYGDKCYMIEYWCDSFEVLNKEQIQCEFGCRFGKCRNITRTCIENDDGLDIFKNTDGTFTVNGSVDDISDICLDKDSNGVDDTLLEYVCVDDYDTTTNKLKEKYIIYEIVCACENGVCTSVVDKECIDTDGNDQYTPGYSKGINQVNEQVEDFDYCMEKVGTGFGKADRCSGESCFLTEYGCDAKGNVVKYVHECPLGCIKDFCIGTECGKNTDFIVTESSVLKYDDNCDMIVESASDPLDLPGSGFDNMKSYSCCSGSSDSYCVYEGTCYPSSRSSNYYELGGEIVACGCMDSSCNFEDGNHVGVWHDLDAAEELCVGTSDECNIKWYSDTGFKWTVPGIQKEQAEGIWEYENNNAECCGDDSGEYVACDGVSCICCDSSDDDYVNGKCGKVSEQTTQPTAPPPEQEPPKTSGDDNELPISIDENQENGPNWIVILPVSLALVLIIVFLIIGKKYLKE